MKFEEVIPMYLQNKEIEVYDKYQKKWVTIEPSENFKGLAYNVELNLRGFLGAEFRVKNKEKVKRYQVLMRTRKNHFFTTVDKYVGFEAAERTHDAIAHSLIKESEEEFDE